MPPSSLDFQTIMWLTGSFTQIPARIPVLFFVYHVQHIQVNKAASIFLFVAVHVIVLNWVWQNKNRDLSSPKTCWFSADVFIGRSDHDCTVPITNATHIRFFFCCFVFCIPLIAGLWVAAVTVWTVMGGNCCPSLFYSSAFHLTLFALFHSGPWQRPLPNFVSWTDDDISEARRVFDASRTRLSLCSRFIKDGHCTLGITLTLDKSAAFNANDLCLNKAVCPVRIWVNYV